MTAAALKVTCWRKAGGGALDILRGREPIWIIAVQDDGIWRPIRWFDRELKLGYLSKNDGDKWTQPPEDDWPEEVCVEMAKLALLMGDNEDGQSRN